MKKIIALTLVLSFVLTLFASCDDPEPSQGGSDGASQSTMMTVATDLANEVDKMPEFVDVVTSISAVGASASSDDGTSASTVDAVSYDGVESVTYYHRDYLTEESEQYWDKHRESSCDSSNATVSHLKKMKNKAVDNCKQLGVWVKENPAGIISSPGLMASDTDYRYRISYDLNKDAVTVEIYCVEWGRTSAYTNILVQYSPHGKLMIDGYVARYTASKIDSVHYIHYLEDSHYMSIIKNSDNPYDEDAETIFFFNEQSKEHVELSKMYDVQYDENDNPTYTVGGVSYKHTYTDGGYIIDSSGGSGDIYNSDERLVATWDQGWYIFSIDMFDGWKSVVYDPNNEGVCEETVLNTKTNSYTYYGAATNPDTTLTDFDGFKVNLSYTGIASPIITIRPNVDANGDRPSLTDDQIRAAVGAVAARLGLTVKNAELELFIRTLHTKDARDDGFEFTGRLKGCRMRSAHYDQIKSGGSYADITLEELNTVRTASSIEYSAQQADNEYFELLYFDLFGNATVNESTAEINLSSIGAVLESSVLLRKGEEYKLEFYMVSDTTRKQVGSYSAVCEGLGMEFGGKLTVSRDQLPINYGTFTLVCYITDADGNRISKTMPVSAERDMTLDLTNDYRGTTLEIKDKKISVFNYQLGE